MLFAVPLTMLIAASNEYAFKSGILISAIFFICSNEIEPTLFLFGSPEPLLNFKASKIKETVGGVFVINVNDLSSKQLFQLV